MLIRDIIKISKGTKVILAITFSVSVLAIVFAFFYYRSINNSEDPRITRARELLARYDRISGDLRSIEAFPLLDSAFNIFNSIPDYRSSFETGVIYNNKCSGLLMMVLYDTAISEHEKRVLLDLSLKYCDSSISVYRKWITEWESLSPEEINKKVSANMNEDDPAFGEHNFKRILSRRIKTTISAQVETPRRLSVSLTNKGTIYRHMLKPDSSLFCYQEALLLWKDNRTAKSNLSVFMGGEPVKPTLIQSLFPPDKNKK
jgi:hypothetical protein